MRFRVGTSGFAYKEWKGSFYPEDMKPAGFLPFYASRFKAVEMNNTFYRVPTEKLVLGWAEQVPEDFSFILKAPQRITHFMRLKEAGEDLKHFLQVASLLGPRLGPTLYQLPPNMKKDLSRLQDFLALLPQGTSAFEFRHATWFDDEVYGLLRAHDAALVMAETDPDESDLDVPFVPTASFGYLRLRRTGYDSGSLRAWADRLRATAWREASVFFKHEDAGTGPRLAAEFIAILDA